MLSERHFFWNKRVLHDETTGREVWQMTDGEYITHSPYMYCRAFSYDEKFIIVTSNRTGSFQLYRLDIETGDALQLSQIDNFQNLLFNVDTKGKEVVFIDNTKVKAICIETGEERLIADCHSLSGGQPVMVRPSLTGDGKYVYITHRRPDGKIALLIAEYKGSTPYEVYVFDHFKEIGHPNVNPADNNVIIFNPKPDRQNEMDLPYEKRARAWKLEIDKGIISPFLVMEPGYRATHEYWSPDGLRFYYHKKHVPGWTPASICSIAKEGGDVKTYCTSHTIKLGHSSVNQSQTKIVSDCQLPDHNQLILIDAGSGKYETLCWPNTSGTEQLNHVHPAFSPSGKKIIYTSDCTGYSQVYILPLNE